MDADSRDAFLDQVLEYARQFTRPGKATFAVGNIKRACQSGGELPLEQGLALERELQAQLFNSSDAKEGLNAYVEKRKPSFSGSSDATSRGGGGGVRRASPPSPVRVFPHQRETRRCPAITETELEAGRLFIAGEWQDAASGRNLRTLQPRHRRGPRRGRRGRKRTWTARSAAARAAFEDSEWSRMPARKRGRLLHRIADAIEARTDDLARLETLDNGKPFRRLAPSTSARPSETFRYYAGWADKIEGEVLPANGNYLNYTRREPVGVCGQIIPWNYPFQMAAWKVAPALACGNTVVLKPAEQTPLTALELARIAAEAGLPAGVLNVVPGFGETAGARW
jgi:hypothetical protein